LIAILSHGAGTFAFRLAGPLLHQRLELSERAQRLMSLAAGVLLASLVATAALTDGHHFAGWARTIGVSVAVILALRRAPFPLVVIAAAVTTALLRLAGLS
jgi:uncharacterized membrane protein